MLVLQQTQVAIAPNCGLFCLVVEIILCSIAAQCIVGTHSTQKLPQFYLLWLDISFFHQNSMFFHHQHCIPVQNWRPHNKNLLSTWHSKWYLWPGTTLMRDRRSRSKQQLLLFQRRNLQIHLSSSFFFSQFWITAHPQRHSSHQTFFIPFGCLHFTVSRPVTPWNFSTGWVFWNLTVSIEDSLVYWIPWRFI